MRDTRPAGLTRAEELADRGELPAAVELLCAESMEAEAAALVDERVLRLLARHEHNELAQAIEVLPPSHRSLLAQLALADTIVLSGRADTAQLNDLVERARQQGQTDLASFGTAILVEHLLLHSDPIAVLIAMQTLTTLSQDPLPGTLVLIARARLLRASALSRLFLGPSGFDDAEAEKTSAVADFNRAGWQVDRWLTIAGFHLIRSGVSWAPSAVDRFAALEARDQLIAAGSEQVPWARYAVALTAFTHGDVSAGQAEIDLIARSVGGRIWFVSLLADHLDAMSTLALLPHGQSSDAAVERLTGIVDRVRREYPILIGTLLVQTAHALIDAERADDALTWLGRVQAVSPVMAHESHEREIMACRIALLRGSGDAWAGAWASGHTDSQIGDRLITALDALAGLRQVPMARSMALRSAVTARRAGAHDVAANLLAWARANTSDAGPMTWWDVRAERQAGSPSGSVTGPIVQTPQALAIVPADDPLEDDVPQTTHPGDVARVAAGATPVCELRLLTPVAHVSVNGELRRLAPVLLRMIAVLGALDRPVATEQLIDLLWPDADPVAGRGRIKSAHHRLRQALAPAPDLVHRENDVWSLDRSGAWTSDLAEFQRLAAGDRGDRLQALRMPDGLLWQVQFPYDETLAERRSWLEARWLNLARELTGSPGVPRDEIQRRAERLGFEDAGALITGAL